MRRHELTYITILISYLFLSYSVFFLLTNQTIILLTKEDGFFETFGAVSYLIASILFFILFLENRQCNNNQMFRIHRNIFFLLLFFVFFLAFGEEISWGQRIFHFKVPELFEKINMQKEINIHNLRVLNIPTAEGQTRSLIARLFTFFCFIYCLVIPIINTNISRISKWLKTLNLPIVPIFIGVFFMINYITSKIINPYISDTLRHSLVEIRECNFAFLFLVVGILFVSKFQRKRRI